MDKFDKELTIMDVQRIMRWSYPTALRFAKKHGEIKQVEGQDKYFIPSVEVYHLLDKKRFELSEMEQTFNSIVGNGTNS